MIRCYTENPTSEFDLELTGDLAVLISGVEIEEEEFEKMYCEENVDLADYRSLQMMALKQRSILKRLKIWEMVEN